ncbi:hypothetical protein FB451DRAFT_1555147 [Mycena latifolia]|nr:hypothetical protein FB451DRAFT_1555147 [Mycena latifolia]
MKDIEVLKLSHNPNITVDGLRQVFSITSKLRLVLLDTPISDEQICGLLTNDSNFFRNLEELVHPTLLSWQNPARYPSGFGYVGLHDRQRVASASLAVFTPATLVQCLTDYLSPLVDSDVHIMYFTSSLVPQAALASAIPEGWLFVEMWHSILLWRKLGDEAVAAMAQPRRTLHDKTSYNILPTPPSPTRITSPSPSLSPSNSNSAGSSTEPTTPPSRPRGRSRPLYPESIGRVPLHRRGTSKTYERLEDLLREAGYKETRIFTPETERTVPQEEMKSPTIGASFVGFLSNLVPNRSASLKREEEPEVSVQVYSPPTSPSLSRTPRPSGSHATHNATSQQQPRRNSNAPTTATKEQPPTRRSSNAVNPSGPLSPRRSIVDMQQRQRVDSVIAPLPTDYQQLPLHQPVPARPINRYYQHHPSSSRGSGVASPPPTPAHHPTPTRASTYLRHMTSYDRGRPQSTPPTYARVTDDAEEESLLSPTLPRMPTGWMDNVKRAREYFAVPPLPPISGSPAPVPGAKLGRSVSAKTRGRLSDRTNAHAPPLLTTRLTTARAPRSESQVSASRVVCRSRGSSPVRRDKGKGREADLDLRGTVELPTPEDLARARFLGSGWGTAAASAQLLSPPRRAEYDTESDVSSDGEDEITLARILVPSRHERPAAMERSRSVRSLRRCLELDGGSDVPPVPPLPMSGSGRWSVSLSWGRARGDAERRDADDPEVYVSVAGGKASQRQRPALPAWAT